MKLVVDRLLRAQWQYQPTLTAHDPRPPITIENAAEDESAARPQQFAERLLSVGRMLGR